MFFPRKRVELPRPGRPQLHGRPKFKIQNFENLFLCRSASRLPVIKSQYVCFVTPIYSVCTMNNHVCVVRHVCQKTLAICNMSRVGNVWDVKCLGDKCRTADQYTSEPFGSAKIFGKSLQVRWNLQVPHLLLPFYAPFPRPRMWVFPSFFASAF